jgi:hypothetical protein
MHTRPSSRLACRSRAATAPSWGLSAALLLLGAALCACKTDAEHYAEADRGRDFAAGVATARLDARFAVCHGRRDTLGANGAAARQIRQRLDDDELVVAAAAVAEVDQRTADGRQVALARRIRDDGAERAVREGVVVDAGRGVDAARRQRREVRGVEAGRDERRGGMHRRDGRCEEQQRCHRDAARQLHLSPVPESGAA